jgi:class 3 adenylate cyclase
VATLLTAALSAPRRVNQSPLVTDIVKSTEVLATGGNLGWSHLLSAHQASVRQSLARFGGLEIDTAGDGFLASFALPSATLRCAAEVTAQWLAP